MKTASLARAFENGRKQVRKLIAAMPQTPPQPPRKKCFVCMSGALLKAGQQCNCYGARKEAA